MFSKKSFILGIGVSLIAGIGIGYTKARERFLEAMLKGICEKENKKDEDEKTES